MKDVQVRGETQQRTSRNSKNEIFTFLFSGFFVLLDPDPDTAAQNQLRIHNTVYEVGRARLLGTYNTWARYSFLQKLQKYSGAHKLWFRVEKFFIDKDK